MKKTLTSIILAGALALGSGCNNQDYKKYVFNGKIGNEYVKFFQKTFAENCLKVKKADGRWIFYHDNQGDDLKIDVVIVSGNNIIKGYTNEDEIGKKVLEEAQTQFNNYLSQILAIKEREKQDKIKNEEYQLQIKEQKKQKEIEEGIKSLQ